MSIEDGNQYYAIDDHKLEQLRIAKPWVSDPIYFQRVKISPSATIKMMVHGQSGVEKGIKRSGNPLEVMGLLIGRPDVEDPRCIVISDAQALPVEGFETRVIADDEAAMNFMINLGDTNELTKKERFCGWYHTHPFDVDTNSHCYLSNTDVSTQLQWQRSEDPHGNLWLAIVIDPLRSIAKSKPEMKAFRVYPPEYTPPLNETPDGKIESVDRIRVEKWGNCWSRYYELSISYYMSTLAQSTLGMLKHQFLWPNSLQVTPFYESEDSQRMNERLDGVTSRLHSLLSSPVAADSSSSSDSALTKTKTEIPLGGQLLPLVPNEPTSSSSYSVPTGASSTTVASHATHVASATLNKIEQSATDIALEHCQQCCSHVAKSALFRAFQLAKQRRERKSAASATIDKSVRMDL